MSNIYRNKDSSVLDCFYPDFFNLLPSESELIAQSYNFIYDSSPSCLESSTEQAKRCYEIDKSSSDIVKSTENIGNWNYRNKKSSLIIEINYLINKLLCMPLEVYIEKDDDYFIAKTDFIPVYGFGADIDDAIDMLKMEIEDLHNELNQDTNYTAEWLDVKNTLNTFIR